MNLAHAQETVRALLATATRMLQETSHTPRLDAEVLLSHVSGWSRARLAAERDHALDAEQVAAFLRLLERRQHQEPVAYLVGRREFYGLELLVDRRVLVPRPETELLIDQVRAHVARGPTRIADVGTGSGAIAVALAVHLPDAHISATDISTDALKVAAANGARHHVAERITLLHGDLLSPLPEPVDMVVSNPPYTILTEIDEGVYCHEPHLALDGGPDGLDLYRRLVTQLPGKLAEHGCVLLEIGATQATDVITLLHAAYPTAPFTIHRDLAGFDRVVAMQT